MSSLIQNKLWHSAAMGGYIKTYTWQQCRATPLPGRKIKSKRQILRWSWLWYGDWQVANNSVKWLVALPGCSPWEGRGMAVLPDGGARGSPTLSHVRAPHSSEAGLAADSPARAVTAWGKGISPVPQQYQLCESNLGMQRSTDMGKQSPYSKKGRILSKSQGTVPKCCCRYFLLHQQEWKRQQIHGGEILQRWCLPEWKPLQF